MFDSPKDKSRYTVAVFHCFLYVKLYLYYLKGIKKHFVIFL